VFWSPSSNIGIVCWSCPPILRIRTVGSFLFKAGLPDPSKVAGFLIGERKTAQAPHVQRTTSRTINEHIDFQNRVAAWFTVQALAEQTGHPELPSSVISRLYFETSEPISDLMAATDRKGLEDVLHRCRVALKSRNSKLLMYFNPERKKGLRKGEYCERLRECRRRADLRRRRSAGGQSSLALSISSPSH